jgi:hypothetical protein
MSTSQSARGAAAATCAVAARASTICPLSTPAGNCATSGRACASSLARPSAVSSTQPAPAISISCFESGTAAPTSASNASDPSVRTYESGSCSRGRNKKRAVRVSLAWGRLASSALAAARRPASSPSKLKTTESVKRKTFCTCSAVHAVPSVATALAKPDWASATTSM